MKTLKCLVSLLVIVLLFACHKQEDSAAEAPTLPALDALVLEKSSRSVTAYIAASQSPQKVSIGNVTFYVGSNACPQGCELEIEEADDVPSEIASLIEEGTPLYRLSASAAVEGGVLVSKPMEEGETFASIDSQSLSVSWPGLAELSAFNISDADAVRARFAGPQSNRAPSAARVILHPGRGQWVYIYGYNIYVGSNQCLINCRYPSQQFLNEVSNGCSNGKVCGRTCSMNWYGPVSSYVQVTSCVDAPSSCWENAAGDAWRWDRNPRPGERPNSTSPQAACEDLNTSVCCSRGGVYGFNPKGTCTADTIKADPAGYCTEPTVQCSVSVDPSEVDLGGDAVGLTINNLPAGAVNPTFQIHGNGSVATVMGNPASASYTPNALGSYSVTASFRLPNGPNGNGTLIQCLGEAGFTVNQPPDVCCLIGERTYGMKPGNECPSEMRAPQEAGYCKTVPCEVKLPRPAQLNLYVDADVEFPGFDGIPGIIEPTFSVNGRPIDGDIFHVNTLDPITVTASYTLNGEEVSCSADLEVEMPDCKVTANGRSGDLEVNQFEEVVLGFDSQTAGKIQFTGGPYELVAGHQTDPITMSTAGTFDAVGYIYPVPGQTEPAILCDGLKVTVKPLGFAVTGPEYTYTGDDFTVALANTIAGKKAKLSVLGETDDVGPDYEITTKAPSSPGTIVATGMLQAEENKPALTAEKRIEVRQRECTVQAVNQPKAGEPLLVAYYAGPHTDGATMEITYADGPQFHIGGNSGHVSFNTTYVGDYQLRGQVTLPNGNKYECTTMAKVTPSHVCCRRADWLSFDWVDVAPGECEAQGEEKLWDVESELECNEKDITPQCIVTVASMDGTVEGYVNDDVSVEGRVTSSLPIRGHLRLRLAGATEKVLNAALGPNAHAISDSFLLAEGTTSVSASVVIEPEDPNDPSQQEIEVSCGNTVTVIAHKAECTIDYSGQVELGASAEFRLNLPANPGPGTYGWLWPISGPYNVTDSTATSLSGTATDMDEDIVVNAAVESPLTRQIHICDTATTDVVAPACSLSFQAAQVKASAGETVSFTVAGGGGLPTAVRISGGGMLPTSSDDGTFEIPADFGTGVLSFEPVVIDINGEYRSCGAVKTISVLGKEDSCTINVEQITDSQVKVTVTGTDAGSAYHYQVNGVNAPANFPVAPGETLTFVGKGLGFFENDYFECGTATYKAPDKPICKTQTGIFGALMAIIIDPCPPVTTE